MHLWLKVNSSLAAAFAACRSGVSLDRRSAQAALALFVLGEVKGELHDISAVGVQHTIAVSPVFSNHFVMFDFMQ
jgi:hypothetical protein